MIEQYLPTLVGCRDGSCIFVKNTGMVTNGGCSCERELRRTPEGLSAVRTIHWLRRQIKEAGECNRDGGCVCGGDVPSVRRGCSNWRGV